MVSNNAKKTSLALSRLLLNIGGPKKSKRRLLATVIKSQLLYASPIWNGFMVFQNHRSLLLSPQWRMTLKAMCAHRTVSTSAILVVTGFIPIHIIAREHGEIHKYMSYGRKKEEELRIFDGKTLECGKTSGMK